MIISNDIITDPNEHFSKQKDFEALYIASRKKENRVYTDEQVLQLPGIEPSHMHYSEWETRKRSANRLIKYLENKNKPLSILEIGCGNGWLSTRLASINNVTVLGTDINHTELSQAKRVFKNKSNLFFEELNMNSLKAGNKFDMVIFAASIQYFPSFEKIIRDTCSLLNKDGEIHILDSYFYKEEDVDKAKQRSLLYYRSIGYEQMADFYFHHTVESLSLFNAIVKFDPSGLKNKYFGKKDPFPWICINAL